MGDDAGHRLFDHTADIGIEAWAPDLEGLLAQAGLGLLEAIYDRERVPGDGVPCSLSAEGEDDEDLIVRFLEEILFVFETRRLALREFTGIHLSAARRPMRVDAELAAAAGPFDPERHGYRRAVKAVTYHGLEVERAPGGVRARIILDI